MKKCLIALLALLIAPFVSGAQKTLLIERAGSAKTKRIYVGHVLQLKIKGQPGWVERALDDILPEQGAIVLEGQIVPLSDVSMMKLPRRPFARTLGSALFAFSATSIFSSSIGAIFYRDRKALKWAAAGAGVFPFGKWLLQPRKIRFDRGQFRLRPLDLTFFKPEPKV